MTVVVRPASAADVDAVVAVGHATWPAAYTALAGEEYVERGLTELWAPDDVARAVEAGMVLVAESGGEVTGMVMCSLDDGVLTIWKLYVVPNRQRRGTGSALLSAVLAGPGARAREVRLAYMAGHEQARRFYEGHGFVETHRSPDERGGPDDVWMRLALRG
ncbi:ribosomal protein S18 acetylase RimI-like enzyme [Nocardioides sp. J9]|uniref:GNAT family N-acetyltransferase n=1 Tax=Nocardioides sp. J9 TaxID=935844 RepID=UPI00119FE625|nr:GNAT family N-acetyltransferase [Nocardioides sp. J9]TWG93341.1 ribosomal protein S18 acetylase RimI-like enzyme [Nocardioides sp. J9]